MVRAKFKVSQVTYNAPYNGKKSATIKLMPVYSNDPEHENKRFWEATPSGMIELNVANSSAVDYLELGEEYYVDFTKAPAT